MPDTERGLTYTLVVDSLEAPMYDSILRASSQDAIVLRTPVIYRDGKLIGRGVGGPKPLQQAISEVPDAIDVQ